MGYYYRWHKRMPARPRREADPGSVVDQFAVPVCFP